MNLILPYLVLLILITDINSYNILVFCPLFGHSHSTYFGKLADILTEAGHSVTLFTPAIIDEFRNHSYTKLTKDVIHLDPSPKLKSIGDLIAGNGRYWKQEFSILEIPQSARFFQSVTGELHNVLSTDPRLSAFMTHGGLGSVNEVSYLGKPNVMCPIMGDQMRNAKMLARHNGSVEISKHSLGNSKIVEEAFRKVIYDQSYTIAAKRLAEHLQNQPVKPKYSFLKHAEFAARFGKLPSLDPYSRQMGFSEYFLLDLLFISICLIFLLCLSLVTMNGQFWLALVDTADMVGFTLTFSVNIILLGLIRTRGKHLGTYKYLMSFFSFFSMFYAIVESILGPIMHIENATFFLISRKRFDYSTRLGKINSAFYCACFATSFVLSAVHFVYRYFAACKKVLQTHYDGIKKENVSYIAYVYYQYEDGVRHVYIKNLLGCFVHYFVMSMTFVVVFYCGFSTWWTIREHRGASDRTRQLQNELFNALVLQTLIPSIFMYIPTGVMFIAPFFDVNLNANANFIVFCSFLYPGLDPLILILIIREFRLTTFGIIKGKPGNNAVMDVHTNSRGKVSSVPVINLSG
ncbi:hypothetical protein L3Y34_008668 [Caenorhabditis briggsae]|uniref:Serpentine receptor class r-10 n=1 Tax=Caenorhabditis briggsae TaxID=6238 RepID=A0AAE9D0I0_CAEBR|nr:hypothetical protein L3Y34_008668 [Caenorhabditis briggsae]